MIIRNLKACLIHQFLLQTRGSFSIAFTFVVVLILLILGLVSYSILTVDSRLSINFVQAIQAQYLAEAGIEYSLKRIYNGESVADPESVSLVGGTFNVASTNLDSVVEITSTGMIANAKKVIQVTVKSRPPISDYAIFATGEVTNVTSLDEFGDPAPSLMIDNAESLPNIEDQNLINMAISQDHVEEGVEYQPEHGYPNFNFYFSGSTPNVTHVKGNLHVLGGRTVYGIFLVEGDIILDGSARVYGVLYMITPNHVVIHGGGSPTESTVTGGIIANGNIDGTGNHITVLYNPEYMGNFGYYENREGAFEVISWREI